MVLRSEELVLLAVLQLGDNAYGVSIRRYLMEQTGQKFSFASVYEPLDRLTAQGFLKSVDQAASSERGGRRKRCFRITKKGLAALAEIQEINAALWRGVPELAPAK
jgi:DNA-binding PadR family transcriptional regulator